MLNLTSHLTLNKATINSPNLCDRFSDDDLRALGASVHENYTIDLQSRETWYRRTEAAMDLAMQVQTSKTFPWQGASNIKFPLVTIAALQFHARAYPTIVNGRKVVDARVIGVDLDGSMTKRAAKISTHMSWQLLEQDESWEEETDRSLINVPIVGVAWKKSYFDAGKGHNVSRLVLAKDLVVNYWAKSIDEAQVKTHIVPMYRNDIHERVRRGTYRDILDEAWYCDSAPNYNREHTHRQEQRDGTNAPMSNQFTPFTLLEQHCWYDLDGDGYAEPYIITIEESTQTVLRIVTRFGREEDIEKNDRGQIIKITSSEFFTKIPFIPNPDGSIMDVGFGILLGPLNESVNSTINQLFDAGTLANTAGGFLGRGAKIRGGVYTFDPFQWNRVDATGDDLRKSIYPLPVREPSGVLFQLLGFLIEYTNRISGSTDMLAGENPGQNTPAETSRNMIQQGSKIYSAIYKRVWRSLKHEYQKLYTLNALHLPLSLRFGASGDDIKREDYTAGAAAVVPVADPTITSDAERFAQARLVREASTTAAGYDGDAVERLYLTALGVHDIDTIFKGAANMDPPPPDVKIQVAQMKIEAEMAKLEVTKTQFMMTLQSQQQVNNAKILQLQAQAFKLQAEGESEPEKNRINAFNAAIQAMREENARMDSQINTMLETMSNGKLGTTESADSGSRDVFGMADSSDDEAGLGLGKVEA